MCFRWLLDTSVCWRYYQIFSWLFSPLLCVCAQQSLIFIQQSFHSLHLHLSSEKKNDTHVVWPVRKATTSFTLPRYSAQKFISFYGVVRTLNSGWTHLSHSACMLITFSQKWKLPIWLFESEQGFLHAFCHTYPRENDHSPVWLWCCSLSNGIEEHPQQTGHMTSLSSLPCHRCTLHHSSLWSL